MEASDRTSLTISLKQVFSWIFLFLLIPIWLSDLGVPKRKKRPVSVAQPTTPAPANPAEKIGLGQQQTFDRQTFLLAFERQVNQALLLCLKDQIAEKGSVTLMARLRRQGRLSHVRIIAPAQFKSDCAKIEIEKMEFAASGKALSDESIEIEWRFDW